MATQGLSFDDAWAKVRWNFGFRLAGKGLGFREQDVGCGVYGVGSRV
jgi:hypothetical protein